MKKYLQLFTALFLFAYSISGYSAFMVTQTSFGVDLDHPVTKDTTLINQSNKPVRVRIDFAKPQWAKDKYYLGDQLVAYPKIVVIPPQGKVKVKVAPRIKKELQDGEYVALLVFKELPSRKSADQVTMLMNIGVPYFGRKGKLKTEMDFDNLQIAKIENGYQIQAEAQNNGNFSYPLNIVAKFYLNKKLLKEESLKQGFYREHLVELRKSIVMKKNADYVEIVFANEKINFYQEFSFIL
ncbi:fimbrial biogenesis chaperone [Shewanella psychromarinicola]|uniref:Molecular chaperone n=1 Tax=Shewanella psychromarinicola TaxID=2487742 RepID=A0A3N4E1S2_9GAMM|nr:fimbria/pilus periplasmic chaperone [Shewanella psychromarinicola]AZG35472.1 molecular chaperone [Shewanella psychromarinicola]MCL1084241.1 fimbria/pilus periplasmic chaperone [Shewanella psychromarinicola]RPA31206.1 molecular chaperone [Shewanella psychromarinicola]